MADDAGLRGADNSRKIGSDSAKTWKITAVVSALATIHRLWAGRVDNDARG